MDANGKLVSRRHPSYNTNKNAYGRVTHKTSHMQMTGDYVNGSSGSWGNYNKELYRTSFINQRVSKNGGIYTKNYTVEVKVTQKLTYDNCYPKANAIRARW